MEPTVETATQADIPRYVEVAQEAQSFIRSKGLTQWIPAAHPDFLPNLVAKVERQSPPQLTLVTAAADISVWTVTRGTNGFAAGIGHKGSPR